MSGSNDGRPVDHEGYGALGALIVGGSSDIGLQTACRLADAGVPRIVLAGRRRQHLETAADAVRRRGEVEVSVVPFDAADPDAAARGVEQAEQTLGGIDILVSSVAGPARPDLLHDIAPTDIGATIHSQLLPPLLTTRLALPGMYERGTGSIVLISVNGGISAA